MYIFKAKCNIQFDTIFTPRVQINWRELRRVARIINIVDPSSFWILRNCVIFFVLKENIKIFKRQIIILYANRVSQWNFAIVNQLRKSNHFKRILDVYYRSWHRTRRLHYPGGRQQSRETPRDFSHQSYNQRRRNQRKRRQRQPNQPKPSTTKTKKCRNKSPSSRSSTVTTHQH